MTKQVVILVIERSPLVRVLLLGAVVSIRPIGTSFGRVLGAGSRLSTVMAGASIVTRFACSIYPFLTRTSRGLERTEAVPKITLGRT